MSVWWIIAGLGLGTYLTRFVFLGIVGDRPMPDWVLRHLRYTGVAVLPGLVAPLLVSPDGGADPARLTAAAATVAVGVWRRDVISAVIGGGVVFLVARWLL